MGGRAILIALISAAPFSAIAATLPISGTYGNERGCRLARIGDYSEDDSARILTSEALQTMVTYCSFDVVTPTPAGGHKLALTCASEGSGPEDNIQDSAEISGDATSGYVVSFADGTVWEALKRCE
ncbi:MAG: hypothetical protein KL863_21220 [Rhizobium sp.]|nr:hypothetical protein [Rhizobium sp.]MBX9458347.1 hypothetical protein [Rhizobium sp.]